MRTAVLPNEIKLFFKQNLALSLYKGRAIFLSLFIFLILVGSASLAQATVCSSFPPNPAGAVPDSCKKLPIVFVYGIYGDITHWDHIYDTFIEMGWTHDLLYKVEDLPCNSVLDGVVGYCSIRDNAAVVDAAVRRAKSEHSVDQVILIAHSMGGLASRYFLHHPSAGNENSVKQLITIGSPHQGVSVGFAIPYCNIPWLCKAPWPLVDEVDENGDFIKTNAGNTTHPGVKFMSIFSTLDEIECSRSVVNGAKNVQVTTSDHYGMLRDPIVWDTIFKFILKDPCPTNLVNVQFGGEGKGFIVSFSYPNQSQQIDCSKDKTTTACSVNFKADQLVTIGAYPSIGSTFAGWTTTSLDGLPLAEKDKCIPTTFASVCQLNTNEKNVIVTASFNKPITIPNPDLTISAPFLYPDGESSTKVQAPITGEKTILKAAVIANNVAGSRLNKVKFDVMKGAEIKYSMVTTDIQVYEGRTIYPVDGGSWTATEDGSYSLRVCADTTNSIIEENDNNNCSTFGFNVNPSVKVTVSQHTPSGGKITATGFRKLGNIDCPGKCEMTVPKGHLVNLTAAETTSAEFFAGWYDGNCGGNYINLTCQKNVYSNMTFHPVFVPRGLLWGDANRDTWVMATDALTALRYATFGPEGDWIGYALADVDGYNFVNATDANISLNIAVWNLWGQQVGNLVYQAPEAVAVGYSSEPAIGTSVAAPQTFLKAQTVGSPVVAQGSLVAAVQPSGRFIPSSGLSLNVTVPTQAVGKVTTKPKVKFVKTAEQDLSFVPTHLTIAKVTKGSSQYPVGIYAYLVGSSSSYIQALNMTDFSLPKFVEHKEYEQGFRGLATAYSGTDKTPVLFYLSSNSNLRTLFRHMPLDGPERMLYLPNAVTSTHAVAAGGYVYVIASQSDGLHIIATNPDAVDHSAGEIVGNKAFTMANYSKMKLKILNLDASSKRYAIASGTDSIIKFDVTNPASMVVKGVIANNVEGPSFAIDYSPADGPYIIYGDKSRRLNIAKVSDGSVVGSLAIPTPGGVSIEAVELIDPNTVVVASGGSLFSINKEDLTKLYINGAKQLNIGKVASMQMVSKEQNNKWQYALMIGSMYPERFSIVKVVSTDLEPILQEGYCTINCGSVSFMPSDTPDPDAVLLQASPVTGYSFSKWKGGDCNNNTDIRCITTIDNIKEVGACFKDASLNEICPPPAVQNPLMYTVTVAKSGAGLGKVKSTSVPAQVDQQILCGDICQQSFPVGAKVKLNAIAEFGSEFIGWEGVNASDCFSTQEAPNKCEISINNNKNVIARFELATTARLIMTKIGRGIGSIGVTSIPNQGDVTCGADCFVNNKTFSINSLVSLEATPAPGSVLSRWAGFNGGQCSVSGNQCQIVLDGDKEIMPKFSLRGDANGDGNVSATDALTALQMSVGQEISGRDEKATDMDCSGTVSASDAMKILQIAVGSMAAPLTCPSPAPESMAIPTGPGSMNVYDMSDQGNNTTRFQFKAEPAEYNSKFVKWDVVCTGCVKTVEDKLLTVTTPNTSTFNIKAVFDYAKILPDMVIDTQRSATGQLLNLYAVPTTIGLSKSTAFAFRINNIGRLGTSGTIPVSLRVGTVAVNGWNYVESLNVNLGTLAMGSYKNFTVQSKFIPKEKRTYYYQICADDKSTTVTYTGGNITEVEENNNCAQGEFTVK